jgi:hypothetical protein
MLEQVVKVGPGQYRVGQVRMIHKDLVAGCPGCNSKGKVGQRKCPTCGGSGWVHATIGGLRRPGQSQPDPVHRAGSLSEALQQYQYGKYDGGYQDVIYTEDSESWWSDQMKLLAAKTEYLVGAEEECDRIARKVRQAIGPNPALTHDILRQAVEVVEQMIVNDLMPKTLGRSRAD